MVYPFSRSLWLVLAYIWAPIGLELTNLVTTEIFMCHVIDVTKSNRNGSRMGQFSVL